MELRLTSRVEGATAVVGVGGEIDNFTAPQLQQALTEAFENGARPGIVDLSDTDFLDSSALGVLVGISKQFRATGEAFKIVCPKQHLRRLFEISHLDEVIPVFASVNDALA